MPFLFFAGVGGSEKAKWTVRTFTTAHLKQDKENFQRQRKTLCNDGKFNLPRRYTILNVDAQNNGAAKYVKQKLVKLKEETDKSTVSYGLRL